MHRWAGTTVVAGVVLLVAGCGNGSTASSEPTATVAFRVEAGAGAADVQRTAVQMQARFGALGADGAEVTVDGDRLLVSGPRSLRRLGPRVEGQGVLEFRPVLAMLPSDSPVGGSSESSVLPARGVPDLRYEVGPPELIGGIASARAGSIADQGWGVTFRLSGAAEADFNRLAASLFPLDPPQNSVAIVVDDVVLSAPSFLTASFSGPVQISGSFTHAEADTLAAILRSGAYPVAVNLI